MYMWVVREVYHGSDGSHGFGFRGVWSDKYAALQVAYSRRRVLNSHWKVEVCKVRVSSVEFSV